MSNSNAKNEMPNPSTRSSETHSSIFLSRLDKNELKGIKVAITRRNITDPSPSTTLLRSLDDPSQLIVHFRPDEGRTAIFDRDDVIVNQEKQEERTILSSSKNDQKAPPSQAVSRSSSRSSRSSRSPAKIPERKRPPSPQPHTSRDYSRDGASRAKDYYSSRNRRSTSASRKAVYKRRTPTPPHRYSKRRTPTPDKSRRRDSPPSDKRHRPKARSRSPNGYRPRPEGRRSRSPPSHKRYSRSPYRSERKRSRTPPPPRGRSRSRSPYRSRGRYSRSPHRHDDRRRRRSRSRHRYSPGYQAPRNPYFEGAEFWIPDPSLQPRFIPRQMIPPGAFPFVPPFRPGMPMMIPPRMPFRPRIVYNSNRPPRPKVTPAIEPPPSTSTAGVASKDESPKAAEHSPKNDDKTE